MWTRVTFPKANVDRQTNQIRVLPERCMIVLARSVVLLGVGHTNAHILKEWASDPIPDCRLVCISQYPTATYSGMLPGTLAGQFSPNEMQIDLEKLVSRAGATLIRADVTSVDWKQRVLKFSDTDSLSFNVLSVGVGSIPSGIPDPKTDCVIPVKPMQTFLRRLDDRMEFLAPKSGRTLQIAVVGGGVASVEIALCLQTGFQLQFPAVNIKIRILTAADEIASELAKNSIQKIRRILHSRGIEVLTQTRVSEVNDSGMMMNGTEFLSADCVIWSTGAVAPSVLSRLGLPVDEHGFLLTSSTLQSTADPMVFAVGDSGSITGIPFAKAGVYAVRQSPVLWHNLRSVLVGGPMTRFTPQHNFLKILNTGDGRALMIYKSLAIHARWCWTLKTWIDRRFLRRFQS